MKEQEIPAWMQDEAVASIPQEKLEFLRAMYEQSQGKNQKELLGTMMPLLTEARRKNLTLTPKELALAIETIKKYSSREELEKIDRICNQKKP